MSDLYAVCFFFYTADQKVCNFHCNCTLNYKCIKLTDGGKFLKLGLLPIGTMYFAIKCHTSLKLNMIFLWGFMEDLEGTFAAAKAPHHPKGQARIMG